MSSTIQRHTTKEKQFTIIGVTFLEIKSFVERENNILKPYFVRAYSLKTPINL